MAADLLTALAGLGRLPQRYLILEVSAELAVRQQAEIAKLPADLAARVSWLDALPETFTGLAVGNELLDALPVHLLVWTTRGVRERGVTVHAEQLEFADREISSAALRAAVEQLQVSAPYVSEIGLAARALTSTLSERLARGALLFIDYGFGEAEYYHPQRNRGTLMCHYRHRVHDDPFFLPGQQDITSHVDFSAVARAGTAGEASLIGYTTQAHFLVNLGITELLSQVPAKDASGYARLAAGAQKLLSPAEMGELVKVIALGKGLDAPLAGFTRGDLSRLL
jgi:SAM-dependent MidA family methyltransferase